MVILTLGKGWKLHGAGSGEADEDTALGFYKAAFPLGVLGSHIHLTPDWTS